MSDFELESVIDVEEGSLEDYSYQACCIYRTAIKADAALKGPPKKKRKVGNVDSEVFRLPRLSQSLDTESLASNRWQHFDQFWEVQQLKLQPEDFDHDRLTRLTDHLERPTIGDEGRLRVAILLTGLDGTNYTTVLDKISQHRTSSKLLVRLHHRQCMNLQSALKHLIRATISASAGEHAYSEFLTRHKKFMPLSFDLELLEKFVNEHTISQVIVSLTDVESFDRAVTSELISTMHLWREKIPFALILGITSTRELFEHRLSKSCLRNIKAAEFDFSSGPDVFSDTLRRAQGFPKSTPQLFLGPSLIHYLHEANQLQGRTVSTFRNELHYAYMSHCYVNALSILADPGFSFDATAVKALSQAVRHTESFRQYCQILAKSNDKHALARVRRLLDDDAELIAEARMRVQEGQHLYGSAVKVLHSFADLAHMISVRSEEQSKSKFSIEAQLYQALADLSDTELYDKCESQIKALHDNQLMHLLNDLGHDNRTTLRLGSVYEDLRIRLHTAHGATTEAPATPKKRAKETKTVQSGKQMSHAGISQEDFVTKLKKTLQNVGLDVGALLLHEAYILTSRAIRPKFTFDPQPRAAIERALLQPGDYLGWHAGLDEGHDEGDEDAIKELGLVPAASVLFALLQEAPNIINVRDLFDAFRSRLQPTTQADDSKEGAVTSLTTPLTQFYRALAEMKMVGLVKPSTGTQIKRGSRGKHLKTTPHDIDFIAKTSWATL